MYKVSLLAGLILLAGCSGNKTIAQYQPSYDFSGVEAYSLYERSSDFSDYQNLSHADRNSIEIAIENALDAHGLVYLEVKDADVIVSYHYLDGNFAEFQRYNKGVKYCAPCLRKSNNPAKQRPQRGSLVLDILDKKQERTVWRANYPLRLKVKDNSREIHSKVSEAVSSMLALSPIAGNN
jgi:hypothetical protein